MFVNLGAASAAAMVVVADGSRQKHHTLLALRVCACVKSVSLEYCRFSKLQCFVMSATGSRIYARMNGGGGRRINDSCDECEEGQQHSQIYYI